MSNTALQVQSSTPKWTSFGKGKIIGVLVLLITIMVVAAWFAPRGIQNGVPTAGFCYLAVLASMFAFVLVIGWCINGRLLGVLINEQNMMSLSRFQTAAWMFIVLSAYFTMAIMRVHYSVNNLGNPIIDPLAISIDPHIWALLGISLTSLVGTPLIKTTKKRKIPQTSQTKNAAACNAVADVISSGSEDSSAAGSSAVSSSAANPSTNQCNDGILFKNSSPADAQFSDIFRGDEISNAAYVDISKVQMFFFTIILCLSYSVALFMEISAFESTLNTFPPLHEGFLAILGISHAAYLTNKAIDHTVTQ